MFKNFSSHNLSLKKPSLLYSNLQPSFVNNISDCQAHELILKKENLDKNSWQDLILFKNNDSNNNSAGPWGPWGQGDSKKPSSSGNNSPKNSNSNPQNDNKNNSQDNKNSQPNDNDPEKKGQEDKDKNSSKTNDQNPKIDSPKIDFKSNQNKQSTFNSHNQSRNRNNQPDDRDFFDKIIDDITDFLKNINFLKIKKYGNNKSDKSIIGLIALSLILFYLATGFYKVNTDENAAILYFGKFYKVATPGLNYYLPYPFGQVIKKSVTTVNTEEFGFASDSRKSSSKRNFDAESLMLTGDENIVDIEFQVQWQISDIRDFVFNIAEPNPSIRKSAESAMREIIARTPIADALSDGKQRIEQEAKILLQEILDSYGAGVRIILVQMRRVDPPSQVIDAFRDVQTAKADKEKEINQAQAYANDIIPRARGLASQMLEQSQAYSKEIVANSEGEAGRFSSIYTQYSKAKQVTKKRLYLETMEQIYRNIDKVYLDKSVSKSAVLPYFPVFNNPNNEKINSSSNSQQIIENTSQPVKTTQKP
jgi:membrane protease subunit HflK